MFHSLPQRMTSGFVAPRFASASCRVTQLPPPDPHHTPGPLINSCLDCSWIFKSLPSFTARVYSGFRCPHLYPSNVRLQDGVGKQEERLAFFNEKAYQGISLNSRLIYPRDKFCLYYMVEFKRPSLTEDKLVVTQGEGNGGGGGIN